MKNLKKKTLFIAVLTLFVLSFATATTASVKSVVGKVEVQRDNTWIPLNTGDKVDAGSVISTGFRSSAVLEIGQSLVEVKALTRLTIEEIKESNQNYSTSMFLDSGKIQADIKKSENKRVGFKVKTTVATASVRGTSGTVYADGKVICTSGKWAITPPEARVISYLKSYEEHKDVDDDDDDDKKSTEVAKSDDSDDDDDDKDFDDDDDDKDDEKDDKDFDDDDDDKDFDDDDDDKDDEKAIASNKEEKKEAKKEAEKAEEKPADQDFYDAINDGAFTVTKDQTITISNEGKIIAPQDVAVKQATSTNSTVRPSVAETQGIAAPSTPTPQNNIGESNKLNKGTIDITITLE